ncbi:MAG: lactonase family protein [Bacteroidota bacterium]|nr:lactonase family protein [Bacteroidota bacterium]
MRKIGLTLLLCVSLLAVQAQNKHYRLLVGTYTNPGKSEGIYLYDLAPESKTCTQKFVAKGVENPSFVALTRDHKFLYSVNQNQTNATISAFSFDEKNGTITFINKVDARGEGPCYITVTDHHVITANYTSGSLCVFGRKADGSLTEAQQVIQHTGSSINKDRQSSPHVHQTIFSPDGKYLAVNDLGTDKVTIYSYNMNGTSRTLVPHDSLKVKAGSGPRHVTFSKDGKRVYLIQELDGTLSVMQMNEGKLKLIQETSVVKKSNIETGAADIHLSPDGKFLYATNRGTANDISCFSVDKNGTLTYKNQVSTGGDGPRNFTISPDGKYVLVGNQKTDNIVIFKRNAITGQLTTTGQQIKVGAPVCLVFY